ncbi:MAG: lipopolysaccharide heptosyltransferase II [Verrucomicrobiota bacterium]
MGRSSKKLVRPFQFLTFLAFRGIEEFTKLFSLRTCMRAGAFFGRQIPWIAPGYLKLVKKNLHTAFHGEKSADEIDALARAHTETLGRNFLGSMRTSLMSAEEVEPLISYEGIEGFRDALAKGNGVVGLLHHTANWELFARIRPFGEATLFGSMYQEIRNPYLDAHILKQRSDQGCALFGRRDGFKGPLKFLRSGGALAVLMDQHPGTHGIWTPLFNRLVETTTLPAVLAQRTGAPLMFVEMQPDGDEKWKIIFHQPIDVPEGKDPSFANDVTFQLNQKLSDSVRRFPKEWFWVHNRFKSRPPIVFPQKRKMEVHLPEGSDNLTPFRILVRSSNPLGDACMAIPSVRAMKRCRPDAHITILCRDNLVPLWEVQPEIDDIIAIPGKPKPAAVAELIRDRQPYYDVAVLLPNSTRSAMEVRKAGIKQVYGYLGQHRKRLLHSVVPEPPSDPPTHHLNRYLHIAEFLGADISDVESLCRVPDPPTPIQTGDKQWTLGLCPGAEFGNAKRWPLDKFKSAVAELRQKYPDIAIRAVIVGSPAEQELCEELAEMIADNVESTAGKTTVAGLVQTLQKCHAVISNDTGTMHMAATLGVPTVGIFGSTSPILTSPIGQNHRIAIEKVECSPCFKRDCPIDFRCLENLEVSKVVDQTVDLIESQVAFGANQG